MNAGQATNVFAELGRELGFPEHEIAGSRAVTISFNNGVQVLVSLDDEHARLVLESDLGPWPEAGEGRLRLLLKNNYVWSDPAVQFALRPTDDNVVAFRCLDAHAVTLEQVKSALSALLQEVAAWSRRLQSVARETAAAPGEFDPPHSLRI